MAHSSLLGIDPVAKTPSGRDSESLGPSDTSDSGSDVAGLADEDAGDPGLPSDVATEGDRELPETSFEAIGDGSNTDSTGTGERRSAAGDAGSRDGADIAPDRVVFDPNTGAPADGVLDTQGGGEAPLYASASEAGDIADADDGDDDENDEVEPRAPGGTHPKAAAPGGTQPKKPHSPRRERDHGLSGPDPDVPAQTPHPDDEGGDDEGANDEGDDTVVVPRR
jgi:hypothetical protein